MSQVYFEDVEPGYELTPMIKEPTREQLDALNAIHEKSMGAMQALQYRKRDGAHEEAFLDSDRPRIKRMADKLRDLGVA